MTQLSVRDKTSRGAEKRKRGLHGPPSTNRHPEKIDLRARDNKTRGCKRKGNIIRDERGKCLVAKPRIDAEEEGKHSTVESAPRSKRRKRI